LNETLPCSLLCHLCLCLTCWFNLRMKSLYEMKFKLKLKNERNAHSLYSFSFLYNHIRKFFHVYEGAWPN
jgi:hypothetical protein